MNCGKKDASPEYKSRQHIISTMGTRVERLVAFNSLYENTFVDGALSSKVKRLIALAMVIAQGREENISHQVGEALRSGASRDEIREAVTVSVLTSGTASLPAGIEALASVAEFEARELVSSDR